MSEAIAKKAGIRVHGQSEARFRTGFQVHGLGSHRICLDVGMQFENQPDICLITHGHTDHWRELNSTLQPCEGRDDITPHVFGPAPAIQLIAQSVCCARRAERKKISKCNMCLNGVIDNQTFTHTGIKAIFAQAIGGQMINLSDQAAVEVWELHHTVPTVGYGLCLRTNRLKPEFQGINGPDLKRKKLDGVTLSAPALVPKLAFICDTSQIGLDRIADRLKDYPVVMIECTFIKEDQITRASSGARRHMHLLGVSAFAAANPDVLVVAIHFSREYRPDDIRRAFADSSIPPNLIPWLGI